jgi:hypothetical protein
MNKNAMQTNHEALELARTGSRFPRRKFLSTVGAVAGGALMGGNAFAKPEVKLTKLEGAVEFHPDGISPIELRGIASHLGNFTARGEIEFSPGEEEGSLVGEGVVVFTAQNGDLLAGVITWDIDGASDERGTAQIHVAWRDSVEFSDGIVSSTGHFVKSRPTGFIISVELLFVSVILVLGLI